LVDLKAYVHCEEPNNAIYKFEGNIEIEGLKEKGGRGPKTISLGPDNLLLRGMNLRNTEAAFGVVVFAGHDTKVMRNSAKAVYKFSKLEKMMNVSIAVVLSLQLLLALIGAAWGYKWLGEYSCLIGSECGDRWSPYLPKVEPLGRVTYLRTVGTWILIMTNMVPISLMVSLEVVKYA